MRNNRKTLGIFLILLGIVLIILIIIFFLPNNKQENQGEINVETEQTNLPENEELEQGSTTPSNAPRNYQQYDISQEPEHKFNSSDLEKKAKAFAERFGSYTNQSDYGNFTDLKIFMTNDFSDWDDGYVEDLRSEKSLSSSYYGMVTRAVSTKVDNFDDDKGEATIVVSTERVEIMATEEKDPYYQELSLDFVKEKGEWLVDAAYWEK